MSLESKMYEKGSARILKELFTAKGNPQKISSMQIGQQMILKEALRIIPLLDDWMNNKTAPAHRVRYKEVFTPENFEFYVLSVMFLLVKEIYVETGSQSHAIPNKHIYKLRHTLISKINSILFDNQLEFHILWRFIEKIIDEAEFFSKYAWYVSNEEDAPRLFQTYTCSLPDDINHLLSIKAFEAFYPLPMETKPINWLYHDGLLVGGYETYQYELIRKAKQEKIDYSQYPSRIFEAVNYIQSVPWRINKEVLKTLDNDLKQPKKEDYIKTIYPSSEGIILNVPNDQLTEEQLKKKEEYYATVELYYAEVNDLESAIGKWRATRIAIDIAKDYIDKVIYFPHNYDFRGRIYPLAIGLSPQGSDSIKGILEFANGQKLNDVGEEWCWAYLASLYGDDKLPFKLRVERGKELIHEDYRNAEEPYQFLSHQLEIKKWLQNSEYKVKTRIHLDACNSGSQFTSAITGDKKGCQATNVIPHPEGKREDAYQQVANVAIDSLISKEDSLDDIDKFILELLLKEGRKICKKPVMVSNYGGTAGGRIEILYHMLRELNLDRKWINKKVASKMSAIIGNAIEGVLVGGKLFERYIQKMSTLISKYNSPITWSTPDGFQVIYSKYDKKIIQHRCNLNGKAVFISDSISCENISPRKMKNSASPNYIHSLDATLLRRVALNMKRKKIKDSSWIHDSFGCLPNHVNIMLEITKKEFIRLIRDTPLASLDEELKYQAEQQGIKRSLLKKIEIPKLRGFKHTTGLDELMNSEWFFS